MIEARGLTKYYGPTQAIQNVSFRVEQGEIVGFLGPNAAGKTTTMRVLTCYLPPTAGTARVAGFDVIDDPLEVRRRIGYLPEHPPLYPEMRVHRYLDFVGRIKGLNEDGLRTRRIEEVMGRVGVTPVRDQIIGRLSKGFRQRVGLAQALLHDPPVLILDEPTSGLDPKQTVEVRELIKSLRGDHTIILSTHILPEVSVTCERVLIINEGLLVAEDRPENLMARFQGADRVVLEVVGPPEEVGDALAALEGVQRVVSSGPGEEGVRLVLEADVDRNIRAAVAEAVVRRGWDLLELRREGVTLEEVFLRLTTEEASAAGEPLATEVV